MKEYKVGDIIEVTVSGIEPYGIFVNVDDNYSGLIHISEVDNNYVKDINSYVKIGDKIYSNIIDINEDNHHLSLSIKNMNYNNNDYDNRKIKENVNGFLPLHNKLDSWIEEKKEEIKNSSE